MDVFEGPSTQELGEERGEGVVYSVILKRVHYGNQSMEPPHAHLRWVSQKVRTVLAGSVEKLVEHLAPEPGVMEVSQAYRMCFLCTFRSFTQPGRVLELLVKRYLSLSTSSEDSEDSKKESETKTFVRHEILSFLRLWLETHPQDFRTLPPSDLHLSSLQPLLQESHDLARALEAVVKGSQETKHSNVDVTCEEVDKPAEQDAEPVKPVVGVLCEEVDKPAEQDVEPVDVSCEEVDRSVKPVVECLRPSQSPLFSMSAEEFTNSLTSEDARLFLGVSAPQCLAYIRSPKDPDNAPSVRACIQHFNRVSLVVIATVLGGVAPDARAFIIGQWIDIAHNCRAVKNFSSLKAIVSGLQSTAVFRLKKSWEKLSNSKLHLFEELSDLLSSESNHQTSRGLLNREGTAKYAEMSPRKGGGKGRYGKKQSMIGVVPYLGTFLTDLTMIHSAYQDKTLDGLVNFDKFRKLFQLLAELTLYQKSAANYGFSTNHALLHWLKNTHTTTPGQSYELSRQLEPEGLPTHLLTVQDATSGVTTAPMSPSRVRRGLRHIFNLKGSSVGDYTLHHHPPVDSSPSPTHRSTHITTSLSARELSSVETTPPSLRITRAASHSPLAPRRGSAPARALFSIGRKERAEEEGGGHGKRDEGKGGDERTSEGRGCGSGLNGEQHGSNGMVRTESKGRVVKVAFTDSDHCNYKSLKLGEADKTQLIIKRSLIKLGIPGEAHQYNLILIMGEKRQLLPANANVYYALTSEHHPTLLINPKT